VCSHLQIPLFIPEKEPSGTHSTGDYARSGTGLDDLEKSKTTLPAGNPIRLPQSSSRDLDGLRSSGLGYGYTGARTDTTQQTNLCLGVHHRYVWLHSIRHVCPDIFVATQGLLVLSRWYI